MKPGATIAILVLVLSACGRDATPPRSKGTGAAESPPGGPPTQTPAPERRPPGPSPAAEDAPSEPPPTVSGVEVAPPPSWIETRAGKHWLAFASYCWSNTCVDYRPVEQRKDIPQISVQSGETVVFHLRFRPTELELMLGDASHKLAAEQTASWSVRGQSGLARLLARESGNSAEYVAHFVVG